MNLPHSNVTRLRERGADCGSCRLAALCLPVSLRSEDMSAFDQIIHRSRPISRGSYLFQTGERFHSIYAIRSGAVKMSHLASDGVEHITGFHLPGEIIGLDAISFSEHPTSAVALETTSLCEIPFERLEQLAETTPDLQRALVRLISKELFAEQEIAQSLAKRSAEERLAIMLLNLSGRFARRGLSARRFLLPMSRHDLGNYLGLAPETMSRLFKRLEEQGLIATAGKEVELVDMDGLHQMAKLAMPAEQRLAAQRKA
jgi:CRP/FNR family transcriptional regulator